MRTEFRALLRVGLLVGGLVAACQPASSPSIPEAELLVSPTAGIPASSPTPSLLPPTDSPTSIPSPTATLAPFPAVGQNASINPSQFSSLKPANYSPPLALSAQDHFYFAFPIPAALLERPLPSSRYASPQSSEAKGGHTGLDFGLDYGTPVLAAASGTVLWSGYGLYYGYENQEDPYGLAVAVRHDFGYEGERLYTVYAHLSESKVKAGQRVESGEVIALSGNSGFSSGPHLHFEVRVGQNDIYHSRNPELWLTPPEGWGVLVGRLFTTYGTLLENQPLQITSLDSGRILWVYNYSTDLNVGADPYYQENFVLSDLPAGRYEVAIPYVISTQRMEVDIHAGAVTFFSFHGFDGFRFELPQAKGPPHIPTESHINQ